MHYSIIQPPFTLDFTMMAKEELLAYFDWFLDAIPVRLQILSEAVTSSPGFSSWLPDCSRASLIPLGAWFKLNVSTVARTVDELTMIRSKLSFPIEVEGEELSTRTLSVAFDVGMYFAQVFLSQNPSLKWGQELKSKNYVHYGQPVLTGFGPLALNPIHLLMVLAYKVNREKAGPAPLVRLYDAWDKRINS